MTVIFSRSFPELEMVSGSAVLLWLIGSPEGAFVGSLELHSAKAGAGPEHTLQRHLTHGSWLEAPVPH